MLLRVIGDLSIEAIAGIMDKQPGAVRGLLRRAIQTIARIGSTMAVQLRAAPTFQEGRCTTKSYPTN
jgi:DNA-directed RNA polymerase specialized sigma24 family protein